MSKWIAGAVLLSLAMCAAVGSWGLISHPESDAPSEKGASSSQPSQRSNFAATVARPGHLQNNVPVATLPPDGAPLIQIKAELERRADAGDANAAQRLLRDTMRCERLMEIKSGIQDKLLSTSADSASIENVEVEEKKLAKRQRLLAENQQFETLCAGMDDQQVGEAIYPSLLRAGKLGDSNASSCFVVASFDPARTQTISNTPADYAQNAWDLLNAGMENGDWTTVSVLESLCGDARNGSRWFYALGAPSDLEAYKLLKLRRLGTIDAGLSDVDHEIGAVLAKNTLSSDQLTSADAWATQTYRQHFMSSGTVAGKPPICDTAQLR